MSEVAEHPVPVVLSAEDVHMMVRQIRDAKSRIAEEIATCEADRNKLRRELNMVDEHQERVTKADRERVAYLEGQLTAHLLNLRATDDRIKSIKTPWGDVTSREQPPEFERDEPVLLEWCHAMDNTGGYPRLVRYFEEPDPVVDWKAVKALCHVDGELLISPEKLPVPGVTVKPRPLRVEVEIAP